MSADMLRRTMSPGPDPYRDRDRDSHAGMANERRLTAVRVWAQPEPAPRRYVVDDLIPEGATTALYGDGGNGKSYLALYIVSRVALGETIFARETTPGHTLYVDAELDEAEFIRRAYQVARGMGRTAPPEGLFYYRLPGSLNDEAVMLDAQAVVDSVKPVLIVLDSVMAAAYGADLERAADTTAMLKQIEQWGTLLTLDHIPKPGPGANLSQSRQYGSVFKFNLARSVLQVVQADGGGIVLRQTKHNFGPKAAPLGIGMDFASDRVTFAEVDVNDERMAGIEEHLPAVEKVYRALGDYGTGATPEQLAEDLELSKKTIKNHLTALNKMNRVVPLGDGRWCVASKASPDAMSPDPDPYRDRDRDSAGIVQIPMHSNGHSRRCPSCGGPTASLNDGLCGKCIRLKLGVTS